MSDEWLRRAKSPATRASIRRWSRWSGLCFWVGLLLVIGGIAFIVWSVVTERHGEPAFWWSIAGIVVLVLVCVGFGSHAEGRLSEARFADGQMSIGRVDVVIRHQSPEAHDTCDIIVSARVSGTLIRRRIDGLVADSDIGDLVRFRHNTLEPDDLDDALFDGWHGRSGRGSEASWTTRQSRDLYVDAHVSVGRVTDVTSHPGFPGDDAPTSYSLTVSVEVPGAATLRRQVHLAAQHVRSSGPAIRPTIRLRHNTLDPDDPLDACFEGWANEASGE